MKNIIKYTTVLLLTGVLLFTSCKEYLDVNTDPNNPTEVSPDLILPVAQKYTANIMNASDAGGRRLAALSNLMMYNWSQSDGFSWYNDEFNYLVTTNFYSALFDRVYPYALKQYTELENLEAEYDYYKAIGMIMKAYHFQILVDLYGDIPYSEALQRATIPTPKYDDAQTIYEDLIVKLTEAIDLINNVPELHKTPDTDDAIFGGDMMKWKQFANSIKLRILTRQMSMSGRSAYLTAEFAAIATEGSGFIDADVAINPGYLKEKDKQNPFWNLYGKDEGGTLTLTSKATCATQWVLDYLTNSNDPRIDFIYEKPADGHLGVPQGLKDYDTPIPDVYMPDKVSNLGPGVLKGPSQGAVIYTLAECKFNQAEAALPGNGYLAANPKSLYEEGIEASFAYLGATGASTYYGQSMNNVGYDASANKLEAIITQKWIAMNSITAEQSWFDYSRTGFPSNLPVPMFAPTTDRPVRLFYPSSEISANGGNVPTQPDAFTAKIFWAN